MKRFQSNVHPHDYKHPALLGESQTVPNQVASITDIVYRFQGGIIPNTVNVSFDPVDAPEGYINVQNISGFDITDAFHHLQAGKEIYQAYIAEKKREAREKIASDKAELEAFRAEKLKQSETKKETE